MKTHPNQPTLPFASGIETSRDAAKVMAPSAANLRQLVLNIVAKHPSGITCDGIEEITGLRHQTCSARVNELMQTGHIINSGRKAPTRSARGTKAILWILGSEGTVAAVAASKAAEKPARKASEEPTVNLHVTRDLTSSSIVDINTHRTWVVAFCMSYLSANKSYILDEDQPSPFIVTDVGSSRGWVIPRVWFQNMGVLHTEILAKLMGGSHPLGVTDAARATQFLCREVYRIASANKSVNQR